MDTYYGENLYLICPNAEWKYYHFPWGHERHLARSHFCPASRNSCKDKTRKERQIRPGTQCPVIFPAVSAITQGQPLVHKIFRNKEHSFGPLQHPKIKTVEVVTRCIYCVSTISASETSTLKQVDLFDDEG